MGWVICESPSLRGKGQERRVKEEEQEREREGKNLIINLPGSFLILEKDSTTLRELELQV